MTVWQRLICIPLLLGFASAAADNTDLPFSDRSACMKGPIAEFGRYVGDWQIHDSQLAQDGSGWQDGAGARWIFSCLGNGTAVQDFWLPASGQVGTNLRTYNADTESWDIAWAVDGMPGFAHIGAKLNEDGNIVMHYVAPLPTPLRRITFFPPDESGWHWKLEISNDDGANWLEVYRIKATPYSSDD